jgi:hypothetical protein
VGVIKTDTVSRTANKAVRYSARRVVLKYNPPIVSA